MSESQVMIADVRFEDDRLIVDLADGRTIAVPVAWYPRLEQATAAQRGHWEIAGGRRIALEIITARPAVPDGVIGVVGGMHVRNAKAFLGRFGATEIGKGSFPSRLELGPRIGTAG